VTGRAEPPGADTPGTVDLGGCGGCALGCAVTCADGGEDEAREARQVLVGSGVAILLLGLGPGLTARHPGVLALGALTAILGGAVAVLATVAVRAGRPAGDRPARLGFRLLPVGVAGMLFTAVGAVLARVL
jgi:hypothetical protein